MAAPRNQPAHRRSAPVRRPKRAARSRRKSGGRGGAWGKAWRGFRAMPGTVQGVIALVLLLALWVAANWAVQVARKPSELLFPVSDALHRTPTETWRAYGSLFEQHSTARVSPALLAALAQTETSGNPIVRTYWRWSWSPDPFQIWRPASSAVGLFQLIDGTFDQARRLCVHDHVVVEQGAWNDPRSCWFNGLYTRTVPSHSIEMTAAYLDRQIGSILARRRITRATPQQLDRLAAVIHLCGAGAGSGYAQRGFRFGSNARCGDHSGTAYIARVESLKRTFARLAAEG